MLEHELRAVVVVDPAGQVVGFIDQTDVARAYVDVDASVDVQASTDAEDGKRSIADP